MMIMMVMMMMICVLIFCTTLSKTFLIINHLTPNDPYMGRTAPLTSKRCILYIYSTNIGKEYFKRALNSPFFSLQNAVCFIMLTCLVPVLFTFCIQDVLKLKKIILAPKGSKTQWNVIKMYIGLRVKYPLFLSYFNKIWNFQRIFEKKSNIKFH